MGIIEEAKDFVLKERGKHVKRSILFEVGETQVQELAEKLNADKTITMVGYYFMDIKRPEAEKLGKLEDHAKMSAKAVKDFLKKYDLGKEAEEKIMNCVKAHHGEVPFTCKEAEICANADSYKFLYPRGLFGFFFSAGQQSWEFEKAIDFVDNKLDEKFNIISLSEVQQELEPYYKQFKELIKKAKNL